jgi:membrane protein required for colicin V production
MDGLPLTAFDGAVLLVLALSVLVSLVRGATREALTLSTWVGALVVAYLGFPYAHELIQRTVGDELVARGLATGLVFVVPLIGFKVVAGILGRHVPGGAFGTFDRAVGVAFGVARGALIICAAYLGLTMVLIPAEHPSWIQEARSLPYVQRGADWLTSLVPEEVQEQSRQAVDAIEEKAFEALGEAAKTLPTTPSPAQ